MTDAIAQVAGHLSNRPLSRLTVMATTAAADAVMMALCLWFAAFASNPAPDFSPAWTAVVAVFCAVLVAGLLLLRGAYRPQVLSSLKRSFARGAPAILLLSLLAIPLGLANAPLAQWLVVVFSFAVPLSLMLRVLAQIFVRWAISFGALERRAIIAGGGEAAEKVIRALTSQPDNDIRVVAIFDDRNNQRSAPQVLGVPNIGGFWDVLRFVAVAEIDLVLITLPLESEERISWLLATFKALPHQIHLVDFAKGYTFEKYGELGFVLAQDSSFDAVRRWQKRGFDLFFGSCALILTSPIMLLAALAIRLETKGPIFFTQWRHGFANREIPVLKFRSMYHDLEDKTGTDVVKRGRDPRVTRVGALLRKTSIDELPQLFCVLRGDLSLVGPRPHALDARSSSKEPFSLLVEDYASRHRLPPGVTGWAQINGLRGGIDEPEQLRQRVAHDLHYIENWSLWLDLRILLRTPLALLNTSNAY